MIEMQIKYFKDTDTLLLTLSDRDISETRDLDENTILDLDIHGNVVGITIENGKQQTDRGSFWSKKENYKIEYNWKNSNEEERTYQSWRVTIFREDISDFIVEDNQELKKMFTYINEEKFYTEAMKERFEEIKNIHTE